MPEHSGKFASVGTVSTSSGFTLSEVNDASSFSTSNLSCGTGRRRGKRSWSGTVKGYGGMAPFQAGEEFPFAGLTSPDSDVAGTAGQTASGTARVSQVVITWDFAEANILSWEITFTGCLELTWSSLIVVDTTDIEVPTVCGTKILNGITEMEHVTQVVLTMTTEVKTFVNTSTYVNGKCWQGCRSGISDFTLSIAQECTARDEAGGLPSAPPIGTDHILKVYTSNTEFYELKWAHILGYSGLAADNESGDVITRTIDAAKNGFVDGSGKGHVLLPDASQWWPVVVV